MYHRIEYDVRVPDVREGELERAFERLSTQEKSVIALYYRPANQLTYEQVGKELGLSLADVEFIRRNSLGKMHHAIIWEREVATRTGREPVNPPDLDEKLLACWEWIPGREKKDTDKPVRPTSSDDGSPSPEEIYRKERAKRTLPKEPNPYRKDGRPNRAFGTRLCCPVCGNETLTLGRIRGQKHKKRRVRCPECDYRWWTVSPEAFGGTRQVEVRG